MFKYVKYLNIKFKSNSNLYAISTIFTYNNISPLRIPNILICYIIIFNSFLKFFNEFLFRMIYADHALIRCFIKIIWVLNILNTCTSFISS